MSGGKTPEGAVHRAPGPARASWRSRRAPRWIALAVAMALTPLVAEALVRLAAPQPPSWLAIYRRDAELKTWAHLPDVVQRLQSGVEPWTVRTDSRGLRCAEGDEAIAGDPFALLIGDSYTFGLGVDQEDTFCGRVQASAGAGRVLNAGVNGYGPRQYRAVLDRLLDGGVRPSVVVVTTYLGNDFHDCIWDKDGPVVDGVIGGEPDTLRGVLKVHSHLYRLAAKAYHRVADPPRVGMGPVKRELCTAGRWEEPPLRDALAVYRSEFERMARTCRERSIPLLACVVPMEESVAAREPGAPAPEAGIDLELPERKAAGVFRELGISFWSSTEGLAATGSRRAYLSFDTHLSSEGHRIVAEGILGHPAVAAAAGGRAGR